MDKINDRAGVDAWLAEHGDGGRGQAPGRAAQTSAARPVARVMSSGVVRAWGSAMANLAESERLPYDDPAQAVLVGRAQVYAMIAVADTWAELHG